MGGKSLVRASRTKSACCLQCQGLCSIPSPSPCTQLQRIVIRVFTDGPNASDDVAAKIGEAAKLCFHDSLLDTHMVRVIVGCRARKDAAENGAGELGRAVLRVTRPTSSCGNDNCF